MCEVNIEASVRNDCLEGEIEAMKTNKTIFFCKKNGDTLDEIKYIHSICSW